MVIAPAQASATSACGNDGLPHAPASQDQTVVSNTSWQKGSPAGSVDIPLAGNSVDAFEYKVNCGSAITVFGASGTATVAAEGNNRFSHRARDSVTADWTDWVDEYVRIDSVDPINTTPVISSDWRRGPTATFPVTATDATSAPHAEWRVDGGSWTSSGTATVSGGGTHTLDTAAVDEAGNRKEIAFTVKLDDVAPTDTTDTAPVGWQDHAVDLKVDGTDADSGVDHVEWQIDAQTPGSGPDGTIVQIATQGQHVFRTRVVDEVGNVSAWRSQDVWVDIAGPVDLTAAPATWYTTPSVTLDIVGEEDEYGIKRIQWRLDGAQTGDVMYPLNDTVPVTVSGDGVHELEVRMTDGNDRVLEWHTHLIKIDTVHPVDNTTIAAGWLPYSSLNVNVRGTDANSAIQRVEWRIDGGNVDSATSDQHDVTVSGDGVHTLETRVVDNAGLASAWVPRTIKLDATAPTNLTPVAPTGWRNTPYSVVLDGADALSGVASVSWKVQLQGMAEGGENVGSAGHEMATINQDGSHTLSTRVRDIGGTASAWRTETIQIDRVLPTDNTTYPSAPVGNRHVITFNGQDDRSGVAAVEWKLDGATTAKTNPSVTISGEGPHMLEVRVRDNAGNYSAWVTHTITVQLGPDTTAPTDDTAIPTQWRTSAYDIVLAATDDIDGVGVDRIEYLIDDQEIADGHPGDTVKVSDDGVHTVMTRVWDKAENHTAWKTQTLKIDKTRPVDESTIASGWVNSRTITFKATDATSGIDRITYDVAGPTPATGTITGDTGGITLATDGVYTISYSIFDNAGQRLNRSVQYKADTVNPVNTSAAAPTAWQRPSLSLALTGTDAASGIDHGEWRVNGGTVKSGSPAVVTSEGTQAFETRVVDKAGNASPWRPETIKVDHTAPANTTAAPSSAWRNSAYSRTVTGVDAVSGVQRVEYTVDGGGTQTSGTVTISGEGVHTLASRIVDNAGNASEWRTDTIGIDQTVPALAADCGTTAWRNTQPTCSVSATGGLSGLAGVTADGNAVVDGAYSVPGQGAQTIHFRAVDVAGNESVATAEVKIDGSAPSPAVNCSPDAGTAWTCTASASDSISGVSGLAYSVDGSAPAPVGNGATFPVAKGSVTVYATDAAGNGAASKAVSLADRSTPPAAPTPRTKSEAVLLRKGGAATAARLIGQLAISALPDSTTVDLRPLAIGKGTFRFTFKLKTGSKTKTDTKTQKIKTGYSKRIRIVLPAAAKTSVALTVKRKQGRRWASYATSAAKL
jgi:hypothetical protein